MSEKCRFNASEYGNKIGTPFLCNARDDNACRAANSSHELHGALACCLQTAENLLQIGVQPLFVSGVLKEIEDSQPDADNPLQKEAQELKALGIRRALSDAGHTIT